MRVQRAIPFLLVLAFALAVLPAGRPHAAAALLYKVVPIGTLGGAWSEGNAINNIGVVAVTAESTFCPGGPPVCPHAALHFLDNSMPLDLGALSGEGSFGTAVNENSQVAGYSYFFGTTQHAVRFSPGNGLIDLTPNANFARGVDITSTGHVAGYFLGSDNRYHAFIFADEALPLEDLGTIASAPTLKQIQPLDMNDSDFVVGNAYQNLPPSAPGVTHGFLYAGGVMTDLTPNQGWASSINPFGQVTGFENTGNGPRAFVYDNGTKTYLPLPSGGTAAWGYFINGAGQVAGLATIAGSSHGFLYDPATGVSTDIGAPAGQITLKGLGDSGQIVGTITAGGSKSAFLYSGGVFYNLNTLIPANSGWSLTEARAINGPGQITGVGVFQGQNRGFLLTPPPPPPIARDDVFLAAEDIGTGIQDFWLLENDFLPNPAGPFTVTFTTQPAHGRLITQSPGIYVYIPDKNYNGQDSFKYKFNDGVADSNEATITIDLPAVNDPPVAKNDSYSTAEETPLSANVLSNDTDVEADPLTATVVAAPASGTLALSPNGAVDYTPAPNFTGVVTFTYQVSDGQDVSAVATVTITVTPVNDAPVANPDGGYSIADHTLLTIAAPGVLGNDTDVDNPLAQLTAIKVSDPAHGAVTLNSDGSFTYMSAAGYNGPDSFTYRVSDGQLSSNVATVSITVTAVNDPPVAMNDTFTATEDVVLQVSAGGVLSNDTDPDGAPPAIAQLVTGPAAGTLNFNADGSFSYTPPSNFNGQVTFTYKASDGTLFSAPATVTINVTPVNDAPVANPDGPYSVAEDTPLTIAAAGVLANDTDIDTPLGQLTAIKVSDPAHGTLTLNADGSFTYTPAPNYNGPDSFGYRASDGQLLSGVVTVTINVTPVVDPPVAKNDFYTISQNSGAPGVLVNDTVESGPTTAVLVAAPATGTLTLNPDGTFTYVPASPTSGPDSFTYKVMNNGLASNVATVLVNNTCSINWKNAASGLWEDAASWDLNRVPVATDDVCIGLDGFYVVTVNGDQFAGNLTIVGDTQTAPIVSLTGTLNADATLTVSQDVFNAGALNVEGSRHVALTVSGLFRNFASGRLNVNASPAADLAVNLDNRGIVVILGDVTFTGGTITNWAVFQSRRDVTLNTSAFVQQSGRLSAERAFVVSGGTFTYNGGSIDGGLSAAGLVTIRNAGLNFNFNATNRVDFYIEGASTLAGGVPANSIVTVAGGSTSNLTIAGDLVNAGLIGFGGGAGIGTANVAVVSGTLTNLGRLETSAAGSGFTATGSIDNQGTFNLRSPITFTNAVITNQGVVTIGVPVTLTATTFTQSAGTLAVAGGLLGPNFFMTGGTFNFNGGTVSTSLSLRDSQLNSNPATGSGEFLMSGASTLTGTIRAGQHVIAKGIAGGTTLSAVGGVTNQGELGVSAVSFPVGSATLNVPSTPLTNTGLLFTEGGSGAPATLSGDISNQGTLDIRGLTGIASGVFTNSGVVNVPSFLTLEINGGTFKNVAPGSIAGGGFLMIGNGARFFGTGTIAAKIDNAGEFNPGLSPGQLNITGSYQQESTGVFVAEINGPVAGTDYDRMTLTGGVALGGGLTTGGALRVNVAGGYCPQGTFSIITAAVGVVGDFSTKTINNPSGATASATPNGSGYDVTFTGGCATGDTTPPQLTLPGNLTFEATDPAGAVATYAVSAMDLVDGARPVTCNPPSGSTFSLGTTTVTCSASDLSSNTATGSFTVLVADTTPPVLTLPGNLTAPATGPSGAVVTYTASATDLGGPVPVICAPPSGSTFAIGTATVTCTATDASNNQASGSFTVTVNVTAPTDTTPPQITLLGVLSLEATSPAGALILYTASATDLVDGPRPVTCSPASGTTIPLGTTTIHCSASDLSGNTATANFTAQVADTTPPTLSLPGNLTAPATGPSGAVVTYSATATDTAGAATVTCTPPSGSTFAIGTTTVNCLARDAGGNTRIGSFTVTVTTAGSQITNLIILVNSSGFANGLTNSLVQKLQAALDLVNTGRPGACGKLDDFINAVSAQSGKALTQAQAAQLIAEARRVKTVLGC